MRLFQRSNSLKIWGYMPWLFNPLSFSVTMATKQFIIPCHLLTQVASNISILIIYKHSLLQQYKRNETNKLMPYLFFLSLLWTLPETEKKDKYHLNLIDIFLPQCITKVQTIPYTLYWSFNYSLFLWYWG